MKLKYFIFSLFFFSVFDTLAKRIPYHYTVETAKFEFNINFWVNLHHFLYQESYMQLNHDSSLVTADFAQKLNPKELMLWHSTITFYKNEVHKTHFFHSDFMNAISSQLKRSKNQIKMPENQDITPLLMQLKDFSEIYQKYFWAQHYEQNLNIIEQHLVSIKSIEVPLAIELSSLFQCQWQSENIRVDVSVFGALNRFSLRNIPYSTLGPTNIVMTSSGALAQEPQLWLELLFHEASHHLVPHNTGFVANTIKKVSTKLNVEPPRGLWHAYLFYIAGKVTHEKLKPFKFSGNQMYMEKFKIFSTLYPKLRQLDFYINHEKSMEQVTQSILK